MNRKQRRALNKTLGKDEAQDFSEKISLFDKIPSECLACTMPFDKQDKQMVQSWNVVVREDRDPPVRLYCPDCWEKAQTVAREYMKEQRNAD